MDKQPSSSSNSALKEHDTFLPAQTDIADHQEQLHEWGEKVSQLLDEGNTEDAINLLDNLRPIDRGEVIYNLPEPQLTVVFDRSPAELLVEAIEPLDLNEMIDVVRQIEIPRLAKVLEGAPTDLIADIVRGLEWEDSSRLLRSMKSGSLLSDLLLFDDDKAGGLMSPEIVSLRHTWSVPYAINILRSADIQPKHIRQIFVMDGENKLVGWLELSDLVFSKPGSLVKHIMKSDPISVKVDTPGDEMAALAQRYGLLSVPVVDDDNQLKGAIAIEDVTRMAELQTTESIHRLGGIISAYDGVRAPIRASIAARLPWLAINIVSVAAVAGIISLFESPLASLTILVAHLAMVMNQTGVVGNQVTVIVTRALATGDASPRGILGILKREYIVLSINGMLIAGVSAAFVGLWRLNFFLGLLVFGASIIAYTLATTAAVVIPLALKRIGLDPAAASTTLITTLTDIFGSLSFLALASIFLSYLL